MGFTGPAPSETGPTGQGTITAAGQVSQSAIYSHPSMPGYSYPHIFGQLLDVPTFTQVTEDWVNRATASAPVTTYSMVDNGLTRTLKIIRPDGVRSEQISNDDPSSPFFGLVL